MCLFIFDLSVNTLSVCSYKTPDANGVDQSQTLIDPRAGAGPSKQFVWDRKFVGIEAPPKPQGFTRSKDATSVSQSTKGCLEHFKTITMGGQKLGTCSRLLT